jgi:small subunit ribosomal protein S16
VAVRIRLTRTGRKNLPSFRIAAFDGRTRRDGPALEVIGWFNPLSKEAGKGFKVRADRLEHWLRHGARLTMAVEELLGRQGVAIPGVAAKPEAPRAAPRKKAAAPAGRRPPMDPADKARRLRRNARRSSRKAWRARKAAAAAAAAKPADGGNS